jgi:dehydrogenase/reductase SDR family member 7B
MKDKVIIITGGSSGIGKALAFEFCRRGSKVVLTGRRPDELNETCRQLEASGSTVLAIQGDVSRVADIERMVKQTIETFGRIDVLVNNAGISMRALFEDVSLDVIRKVIEINLLGAIYATKYCLPEIKRNKGSIVGISSVAGFRGLPARSGYSASKFGLNGFLEALRTELLKEGVHVLTACPGFTASNIRKSALTAEGINQGKSPRDESHMMSSETCARRIYQATIKRKRTLILTQQGKIAVLLNKWLPALADKLVYQTLAKEPDSPLR